MHSQTQSDLTEAVLQKPIINLFAHLLHGFMHFGSIGCNNHKFSGGVQNLRSGRQTASLQHFQRSQLGKQRHLERTPAQEFGGFFIGLAA